MRAQNQVRRYENKLDWDFFDQITIATGDVAGSFFANTANKTVQQTNFPTNGQLPGGQAFTCRQIAFVVLPLNAATALTIRDVLETCIGRLDLNLNDQAQFSSHGLACPASMGLQVDVTALTSAVQNGWAHASNAKRLDPPIFIEDQRVEVKLTFNPAITLATSAIVRCYLRGTLYRDPS